MSRSVVGFSTARTVPPCEELEEHEEKQNQVEIPEPAPAPTAISKA